MIERTVAGSKKFGETHIRYPEIPQLFLGIFIKERI